MNMIQRAAARLLGLKYDTLDLFRELYGARTTKSGTNVNWSTSLEVTTVLACARVIADGIAQVPFKLMIQSGDERRDDPDHPLYNLLYRKPNRWQTSYEFRETIAIHLALMFNAYVFVGRVGIARKIVELVPLEPQKVEVKKLEGDKLQYIWRDGNKEVFFNQDQIWHIRGPSWNGYIGMEFVKLAREAIGLASSLESAHASLHKNGARTSGALSVDGSLSKAKYDLLVKYIEERSQGGGKEGTPLILDQGAKYHQFTMTGVDSQHLETRKHQIAEICSAFRVSPVMIGHADKSLGLSIEQVFIAHVVHCLTPWYARIEQSAEQSLLTEEELKKGYYVKFFSNGLMRGSAKERAEFYKSAIGSVNATPGWMTINEARALEDLPPVPEGEKLFIPEAKPKTAPVAEDKPDDQQGQE